MTPRMQQNFLLPQHVGQILTVLEQSGWEAWLVGGCVRDSLLGRPCHDYDIATNAPPERVQGLFPVVIPTGFAFGGVTVVMGGKPVEVTAYRSDLGYSDGRHPDSVAAVATMEQDAARRDFTIGALYWHPARGLRDPTDQGLSDLEQGLIRGVGEAKERFEEDALRILRAVRFAAQLGFAIEEETEKALAACAPGLARISKERVTAELLKLLTSPRPQMAALLGQWGALEILLGNRLLPPARRDFGLPERVPPREGVRLAAFCLGIGLPLSALESFLRLSKSLSHEVRELLAICRTRPSGDGLWLKLRLARYSAPTVLDALDLWQGANGEDLFLLRRELHRILAAGEPCRIKDLAVRGEDLLAAGVPGAEIGAALKALLVLCMGDPSLNRRETLLKEIKAAGA